jgi:hypothetical protein
MKEERRSRAITRCYWPLPNLSQARMNRFPADFRRSLATWRSTILLFALSLCDQAENFPQSFDFGPLLGI